MTWPTLMMNSVTHGLAFFSTMPAAKGGATQGLPVGQVLSGGMGVAYATVGLYFLKFWRRSGDSLYGFFAGAFALLAIQRIGLGLYTDRMEDDTAFYMIRLAAFCLILVGIYVKNRPAAAGRE